jgi:tetratricopeptide (TPR) repeat protein
MRALLADAEPLLRVERDEWHLAFATFARGSAALSEGRFDEARTTLAGAIATYERMGDEWGLAGAEMNLAAAHVAQGRYGEARSLAERSVARYEDLGDRSWRAGALLILAVAVAPEDVRRARGLARSAGELALQTGQPVVLPECLISLASFAHADDQDNDAALLLGAGEGLARRLDLQLGARERGIAEQIREGLRRRLGEDWRRIESEGSRLSPEDALALVPPA